MAIELTPVDQVIWSNEVEVLQIDGKRRPCKGQEEVDLCLYDDATEILGLANQVKPTFRLALVYGGKPVFADEIDSNKLSTTYNPGTNVLTANNQPCLGDTTSENGTYLYLGYGGPRCWHIINEAAKIDVVCGRMWRAWTGQQGMAIKDFGAGDTLVWA